METASLLIVVILGWGLFHNFARIAAQHLPVPAMQLVAASCWILAIPLYVYLLNKTTTPYKWNVSGIAWCAAAFLVSNIATFAYMYVLSKNDVSKVVGIATSYPALTMMVAVLFMGESFTWQKFVGLILVLGGVFITVR